MAMVNKSTRWPSDVWRVIEVTAEIEKTTAAEIIRTGTLSYVAFMAGRRGDAGTISLEQLFNAGRCAVRYWPL